MGMGVVVAFEDKEAGQGAREARHRGGWSGWSRADMERVNAMILSRTGSDVTMIPEVANHLISSGGKRLRPMLTLATAALSAAIAAKAMSSSRPLGRVHAHGDAFA